jgi:hypothetical protein
MVFSMLCNDQAYVSQLVYLSMVCNEHEPTMTYGMNKSWAIVNLLYFVFDNVIYAMWESFGSLLTNKKQ